MANDENHRWDALGPVALGLALAVGCGSVDDGANVSDSAGDGDGDGDGECVEPGPDSKWYQFSLRFDQPYVDENTQPGFAASDCTIDGTTAEIESVRLIAMTCVPDEVASTPGFLFGSTVDIRLNLDQPETIFDTMPAGTSLRIEFLLDGGYWYRARQGDEILGASGGEGVVISGPAKIVPTTAGHQDWYPALEFSQEYGCSSESIGYCTLVEAFSLLIENDTLVHSGQPVEVQISGTSYDVSFGGSRYRIEHLVCADDPEAFEGESFSLAFLRGP